MPLEAFTSSRSLTLGVELELQLVGTADLDLASASPDLLELLRRRPFPGTVTPEVTESMIEIATGVHTEYAGLQAQLGEMRDALLAACDRLNIGICGGGTHPFQHWSQRRIFGRPRFRQISELYGYLTKQFTVFGQHVHVGCRSGDEALLLLHALGPFVPQFVALAASSPFVQGHDTLFDSARLNSVLSFPLSGHAPFMLDWEQFDTNYFAKMAHTGIVNGMKDFYWDIRPKPEYGTIELRVCDTPLTVGRAAALACYLQALCAYLLDGNDPRAAEDDYLVYNYNRFQGCRFGLDGTIVDPRTYEQRTLREDVLRTVRRIRPYAEKLGALAALDHVEGIAHDGNDARGLRDSFTRTGSVEGVVDTAMKCFRC